MKNIDIVADVVTKWATPIITDVIKMQNFGAVNTASAWVGKYFPVPQGYNILNEMSFLIQPIVKNFTAPMIKQSLQALPDEDVPTMVDDIMKAMLDKSRGDGSLNIFGENIKLPTEHIELLDNMLKEKLNAK